MNRTFRVNIIFEEVHFSHTVISVYNDKTRVAIIRYYDIQLVKHKVSRLVRRNLAIQPFISVQMILKWDEAEINLWTRYVKAIGMQAQRDKIEGDKDQRKVARSLSAPNLFEPILVGSPQLQPMSTHAPLFSPFCLFRL